MDSVLNVLLRNSSESCVKAECFFDSLFFKKSIKLRTVTNHTLNLVDKVNNVQLQISYKTRQILTRQVFTCLMFSETLKPLTNAWPSLTSSCPVNILNVDVLPAPFTPRSPKQSPKNTCFTHRNTLPTEIIFICLNLA